MYLCPECQAPAFAIALSVDMPSDGDSDDIAIQIARCAGCSFECAAKYEESRRGGLDSECVHHVWFRMPADHQARLKALLEECPERHNPRCTCSTHRLLATQTGGRWDGFERNGFQSLGGGPFREPPEPATPPSGGSGSPVGGAPPPLAPRFSPQLASVPRDQQVSELNDVMFGGAAVAALIVAIAYALVAIRHGSLGEARWAALALLVALIAAAAQYGSGRGRLVLVAGDGVLGVYREGWFMEAVDALDVQPSPVSWLEMVSALFVLGVLGPLATAATVGGLLHGPFDIMFAWTLAVALLCDVALVELVRTRILARRIVLPGFGGQSRAFSPSALGRAEGPASPAA